MFVVTIDQNLAVTWFQAGAAGKIAWALINGEEACRKSGQSAGAESTRRPSMLENHIYIYIKWSRANMS